MNKIDEYEEIRLHMEANLQDSIERTTNELLKYCRHVQEDYMENIDNVNADDVSGVAVLARMTQDGLITFDKFLRLLPAIENYDQEYDLIFNRKEKI